MTEPREGTAAEAPADRSIPELVALLCAHSAPAGPATLAAKQVLQRDAAGDGLPGLRHLSVGLAEGSAQEAPTAGVCAESDQWRELFTRTLRRCPMVVAHATEVAGLAQLLGALLADGHRVLVTDRSAARWPPVRDGLPKPLAGLCAQGQIPLSDLEQRELRSLLLTATPGRRARIEQTLPIGDSLPDSERVAALCRAVTGDTVSARDALELLPELLGELPPAHLDRMVALAQACVEALRRVDAGGISVWARPLLEQVLFGAEHTQFANLLLLAGEVSRAADALSGSAYRMAVVGPPDPDAPQRLRAYIEFLDSGGLPRRAFPTSEQRAVIPVLQQLGLDRTALGDVAMLRGALGFLQLVISMRRVATVCRRLRVPEPKLMPAAVARRHRELERVEHAARAVESFRHEVLFIHPNSPISVPDVATTEMVAREIVNAAGTLQRATTELNELADTLAESMPDCDTVPEVAELLVALRRGHLPHYLLAVERLTAASQEQADQLRQTELLSRLREGSPELADAWEEPGTHRYTQGTARFFSLTELLSELPAPDTADVVLLLDAQTLTPENLLVMASAPRLVAVSRGASPVRPESMPTSDAAGSDSTLAVLLRAGAAVVAAPIQAAAPSAQQAGPLVLPAEVETKDPHEAPPAAERTPSVPSQRNAPPENLPEIASRETESAPQTPQRQPQ